MWPDFCDRWQETTVNKSTAAQISYTIAITSNRILLTSQRKHYRSLSAPAYSLHTVMVQLIDFYDNEVVTSEKETFLHFNFRYYFYPKNCTHYEQRKKRQFLLYSMHRHAIVWLLLPFPLYPFHSFWAHIKWHDVLRSSFFNGFRERLKIPRAAGKTISTTALNAALNVECLNFINIKIWHRKQRKTHRFDIVILVILREHILIFWAVLTVPGCVPSSEKTNRLFSNRDTTSLHHSQYSLKQKFC